MADIILKLTHNKFILRVNKPVSSNSSSDLSSDTSSSLSSIGLTTVMTTSQNTSTTIGMVTRSTSKKIPMTQLLGKKTRPEYVWTKEQIKEWASNSGITKRKPTGMKAKKENNGLKIGKFRYCPAIWVWKLRAGGEAKKVKAVPQRWVKVQSNDCILLGSKRTHLFPTHKSYLGQGEELRTFMSGTGQF